MIEIDLACNKRKYLKKQSNDRHVAKWNGVKVPFFLQIFTQVKVKVCCNKTTPKITIYPKSYSSICNGVNVARSYPPLHTATHIYLKLIVCRYLSAACWPGAEPLRFREALHGPGKVVFLFFREYFVGDLSIPSRLEYNLSISAISWFERAVIVRLRLTRYPAKASTASHPGMPLGSHRLSCHMK